MGILVFFNHINIFTKVRVTNDNQPLCLASNILYRNIGSHAKDSSSYKVVKSEIEFASCHLLLFRKRQLCFKSQRITFFKTMHILLGILIDRYRSIIFKYDHKTITVEKGMNSNSHWFISSKTLYYV